jgi:hypothetical protein
MGYGPSKQNRGAGNSGEQPVQFKLADAQRIANVVGTVEGARRGRKNSTLPRAAGSAAKTSGGVGSLQEGTFAGAWPKGVTKAVNVGVGTNASTINVLNKISSVMPGGLRVCYVVQKDDASWALVNAEC